MPSLTINATTYEIRQPHPTTQYGSPSQLSLKSGTYTTLLRVSDARIPDGAVITSASLNFWSAAPFSGSGTLNISELTTSWSSNVTWNTRPTVGNVVTSTSLASIGAAGFNYVFDVTSWFADVVAGTANRGLQLSSTSSTTLVVYGSSASSNNPVLNVSYTVPAQTPTDMHPNGGAVSTPSPVLTYHADPDIVQQQVNITPSGGATWSSGWVNATTGQFVPPPTAPQLTAGQSATWAVQVTNASGDQSDWSPLASYSYQPLPAVTITGPPATTPDGSPTLTWTTNVQTAWQASLYQGNRLVDQVSGYQAETDTRAWTPSKGVGVPGVLGKFVLNVKDDVQRVSAMNALTVATVTSTFTTTLQGAGSGMDSLAVELDDPVPVLTGVRAAGIPDEVTLLRDGVQVPLWDPVSGDPAMKLPGSAFFTDATHFSLHDYTAPLRKQHTWQVLAWTNGTPSSTNPSVTDTLFTGQVWLVEPSTGDRVRIFGQNQQSGQGNQPTGPAVDQAVTETSIVHVPVTGGPIVEPIRRRLVRTTLSGSITGNIMETDEDTINGWVSGSPATRYMLVFGRVNWPVIIGDYSPLDGFYPNARVPGRVQFTLNWWQKLAAF